MKKGVTADVLRAEIQARFTPEQWAAMQIGGTTRPETKAGLKIQGLGLVAVARVFGIEGNPINYHAVHLALGRAVWGPHSAFRDEVPPS